MANFPGLVLTQNGRDLQSKAQIGAALTFSRVALGDGETSAPDAMAALDNERLSLSIQDFEVIGDGTSRMRVIMTNEALDNGFFVRELGVFAEDPDTGEEQLYSYTNAGEQPDFLPAGGGATLVENVFDLYTVVGNAQNVTAKINDYITIATKQDIDEIRPLLVPEGGTVNQLMRKASNSDGDTEWFTPEEAIGVQVESREERRVAVESQRTFALSTVTTRGLAVYVNGERIGRHRWQPLGATQMRFQSELTDGDEVLFVQNEEVGEIEIARVSLTGDGLIYPGTTNEYVITDYDAFAEYDATASRGTLTRDGDTLTLVLDAGEPDGPLDLNITREGGGVTYALAVGAPRVRTPQITYPGGGDTGVDLQPTFSATAFATYPSDFDSHASSTWVVARDEALTDVVEEAPSATELTSWRPSEPLPLDTDLYVGVIYTGDSLGDSDPSAVVAFRTTDQYIERPTITSPEDGATDMPEQPVIETSAFATFPAGVDSHRATSWWAYDAAGEVIWESLEDTSSLTSIALPAGVLSEGETLHRVEAQHHGNNLPSSDRTPQISFTTSATFIPEDGESGVPFGGGYFSARMKDENGDWYALVTAPKAQGEASGTMTWQQAIDFCNGLTIGGHNDWQLATLDERRMEYRAYKPTTQGNVTDHGATDRVDPPLGNYTSSNPSRTSIAEFQEGNSEAFIASGYWSATEYSSSSAWGVYFTNGNEGNYSKASSRYVRAVRRVYF